MLAPNSVLVLPTFEMFATLKAPWDYFRFVLNFDNIARRKKMLYLTVHSVIEKLAMVTPWYLLTLLKNDVFVHPQQLKNIKQDC